jgi:uncharacterized integral membrane protein
MNNLMWLLKWILRAAIFLALFVFAMDNRQDVTVHFFFGAEWRAPLVLVVLSAFATGLAAGVLAMVPRWWQQRGAAGLARRQSFSDSQLPHSTQTPHES